MSQCCGIGVGNRRHLWRASWTIQDIEPSSLVGTLSDEGFCLNCGLDSHVVNDCPVPFRKEFQLPACKFSSKNAVICLRSDTGQASRHILPYERSLGATVLHINHKENILYVRPDIFQEKAAAFYFRLRCIAYDTLESLGTRNVKIGQVYLAFNHEANMFARAVCGHMKYTHQNITRFQMYFIDGGQLEFIEQKDIYLLPFVLGVIPPLCVPLDLAGCNKSLAFSTCVEHFRALKVGSRIIFVLKNRIPTNDEGNAHNSKHNENFPLAFTSKIFFGETGCNEIICPKSRNLDFNSNDHIICDLQTFQSSSVTFPFFAQKQPLPCNLTVRVARRCDHEGIYWLIDEKTLTLVEKQLVQPINFLRSGGTNLISYPCIAYVKIGSESDLHYCRALTRDFSADFSRCTVFLVDYGKYLTCDVFSLFSLDGQPQTIYEMPGAAFLSVVRKCDANRIVQEHHAYLCEGVTYPVALLSVDDEGVFYASVYLPSVESIITELKNKEVFEKMSSSEESLPASSSPGESVEETLEAHFLGARLWDDDDGPEGYQDLTDIVFTLSRLEEKVTKCYDELRLKLELLQMREHELIRRSARQKLYPSKRGKGFLSRLILARPSQAENVLDPSTQSTQFDAKNAFFWQNSHFHGLDEDLIGLRDGWDPKRILQNCSRTLEERGNKHLITKKNKGVGPTENTLKVGVDVSPKSEGSSSSTDSGIERSDEIVAKSATRSSSISSVKPVSLKYKALFGHKTVSSGKEFLVKRSDGDYQCSLWPLFFVHVFSDENLKILEEHFDSIKSSVRLQASQMKIGTMCIAYCSKYKAKFRAVVTAVEPEVVEVFYVDYGNYEEVRPSTLYSIEEQNYTVRTHPGMAIPCILSSFDVGNVTSEDSGKIKNAFRSAVTTEDDVFCLRFVAQRADGIYVVENSDI